MDTELLKKLRKITDEEQMILDGCKSISPELYTDVSDLKSTFTIDSGRLLEKGCLIEVRPHTRFIRFPKHTHNYIEMVYMCSGSTNHILNDSDCLTLQEGDLLLMGRGTTQEILPAGPGDIAVNFIIQPEFFSKPLAMLENGNPLRDYIISCLYGEVPGSDYLYFKAGNILPVQNLLENMIWTLFRKNTRSNLINQVTMGLLLMNLSLFADNPAVSRTSDSFNRDLVFICLRYIETDYRDGSLTDLAAKIKQPAYSVSRLLKKYTGKTFKELLINRKLEQAAYLLRETTLPTEAVMNEIGYNNSSFFHNSFRKRYGCTPAEFRR